MTSISSYISFLFFFFNATATTEIYTLSLHDALPIYQRDPDHPRRAGSHRGHPGGHHRRFRRAAGNRRAGRARLPDRQLLASAAARGGGLPSAPADREKLILGKEPMSCSSQRLPR